MLNLDSVLSGLQLLLAHAPSGDLPNFKRVAITGRDCKDFVDIHILVVFNLSDRVEIVAIKPDTQFSKALIFSNVSHHFFQ